MEVFYVMVLVLVAGAVPSHGRTESVGTVFNKTQPHESMNNGPVSSMTLEPFTYMYLVMQWPKSFCAWSRRCHQPVPPYFTVHGLWPDGIDCTNILQLRPYHLFNNRLLAPNLRPGMDYHWPNLTSVDNEHYFWQHEYNKHGSCTFNDQNRFFRLTLALVAYLEGLRNDGGPNIFRDKPYSIVDVGAAVRGLTNKIPQVRCSYFRKRHQLDDIRVCFALRSNGAHLTDCPLYSTCGNGRVYLPRQ